MGGLVFCVKHFEKFIKCRHLESNHMPVCRRWMLNFSCGRNTTKPEADKETWSLREGEHLSPPEGLSPICHCATAICPVTDPWTQSPQVNCDSLIGMCVFVSHVGVGGYIIALHLHPVSHNASGCQSSSAVKECKDVCVCRKLVHGHLPLMKWHAGRDVAKGMAGLEMHKSNMLLRQQSMRLCPCESGWCKENERLRERRGGCHSDSPLRLPVNFFLPSVSVSASLRHRF